MHKELLQTPFNLKLYGRVIDAVTVSGEAIRDSRVSEQFAVNSIVEATLKAADCKEDEMVDVFVKTFQESRPKVANIYGYMRGAQRTLLPRPAAYLVQGEGQPAKNWDLFSEDDGYKCWEVDPRASTFRIDLRPGSFEDTLDRGPQAEDGSESGANQPDGGTLIQGADGRVYHIPVALEPFEVVDEKEKSELQLESGDGRALNVREVRLLHGRSTLAARSTLAVRSTLALRSTLAAQRRP